MAYILGSVSGSRRRSIHEDRRYRRRKDRKQEKTKRGNWCLGLLLGCLLCHSRKQRKKKQHQREQSRRRRKSRRERARQKSPYPVPLQGRESRRHSHHRARPRPPSSELLMRETSRPRAQSNPLPSTLLERSRSQVRAHSKAPPTLQLTKTSHSRAHSRRLSLPQLRRTRSFIRTRPRSPPSQLLTRTRSRVRAHSTSPAIEALYRHRSRRKRSDFPRSPSRQPGERATGRVSVDHTPNTTKRSLEQQPVPKIYIISPTLSPPSSVCHSKPSKASNFDGLGEKPSSTPKLKPTTAMADNRHNRHEPSYELEANYVERPRGRRGSRHVEDTGLRRYSPPRIERTPSPAPRRHRSDHKKRKTKRDESPGCSRSSKWKTLYVLAAELLICFLEPKGGGWGQYQKKDRDNERRDRGRDISSESSRRYRHRRQDRRYYSEDSEDIDYPPRIVPRDLSPDGYISSTHATIGRRSSGISSGRSSGRRSGRR